MHCKQHSCHWYFRTKLSSRTHHSINSACVYSFSTSNYIETEDYCYTNDGMMTVVGQENRSGLIRSRLNFNSCCCCWSDKSVRSRTWNMLVVDSIGYTYRLLIASLRLRAINSCFWIENWYCYEGYFSTDDWYMQFRCEQIESGHCVIQCMVHTMTTRWPLRSLTIAIPGNVTNLSNSKEELCPLRPLAFICLHRGRIKNETRNQSFSFLSFATNVQCFKCEQIHLIEEQCHVLYVRIADSIKCSDETEEVQNLS